MQHTVKAKIHDLSVNPWLDAIGSELCRIGRILFKRRSLKLDKLKDIKREFIATYGITARQFNSLVSDVDALISAQKELKTGLIKKTKTKKKNFEKKLEKSQSPFKIHQYKRKVFILEQKIERFTRNLDHPKVCFGGKNLFNKQFHLKENGYLNHEQWKKDWNFARNTSFFLIGSKSEKWGNQSCQLLPGKLKLRLTSSLSPVNGGKYLEIPIEFTYCKELVETALNSKQAMSYRFVKNENGFWYVHLSFELKATELISDSQYGALGIDLNPACIAASHVDSFGNLVKSWQIPLDLNTKRSEQRQAILGDAVSSLVTYAVQHKIPISIEELNFEKKKQELRSRRMNRMLSEFSYSLFHRLIQSQGHKKKIEVKRVNPAYTSILGDVKFGHGYGLSTHMAAAMAVARRYQGFGECIRMKTQVHLPLLVRNRGKHVWSDWARLNREAKRGKKERLSFYLVRRQRPDRTPSEQSSREALRRSPPRTRKGSETEAIFQKDFILWIQYFLMQLSGILFAWRMIVCNKTT